MQTYRAFGVTHVRGRILKSGLAYDPLYSKVVPVFPKELRTKTRKLTVRV